MDRSGRIDYDRTFLTMMDDHAARSAAVIVPLVRSELSVSSLADFGCGRGEWLRTWEGQQTTDLLGIDGPYIPRAELCCQEEQFLAADLSKPVRLGRRFDLVQALEVAEHLPAESADDFVDSLTAHSSQILFSAAVPGQMGIRHVNERPLDYWRDKFAHRDYVLFDWLRPRLVGCDEVSYWYRQNVVFFAHSSVMHQLPRTILDERVSATGRIRCFAPLSFTARCAITRWLPVSLTDQIVQRMNRRSHGQNARRSVLSAG